MTHWSGEDATRPSMPPVSPTYGTAPAPQWYGNGPTMPPPAMPPAPVPPPAGKRPTAAILSIVGAVVVVGIVLTLVLTLTGPGTPKTFTLHGTMSVTCTSSYGCTGFSDIHSGAQVEVYNEKQEILATGVLTSSVAPTATSLGSYSVAVISVYSFDVPNVPRGQKQYGVHAGNQNRGIIWADENDATTLGFALTLGS